MGLEKASYIDIDDTDPEPTHLWVTVNDADGAVIEIIEQYPLKQRVGAFAMARRLANLLNLPLKLREDWDREARPITDADFPSVDSEKKYSLCGIMGRVHDLADFAWPRDGVGRSKMPDDALRLIIDIQQEASVALGLPEDLDLMTGDPLIDL